jgi:S-(hydroxymethyl)glutathione dehydrogenase/alcohol dehydrogenase
MLGKAAILRTLNSPLCIEELDYPPLDAGQVLVKVAFTGVCKSQLMEIEGQRGIDRFLPHLLGHEASGEVIAVGDGVTKVIPGNNVVISWIRGNGLKASGPEIKHNDEIINSGSVTTFSEYTIVAENSVFPIPDDVSLLTAALFGCAIPTGAGMVLKGLPPNLAQATTAVFGLGGIGISSLHVLASRKPKLVLAVDNNPAKLEVTTNFENVLAVDASAPDFQEKISTLTGGIGLDFAIDATGTVSGITAAYQSVRKFGGLCIFASHPKFNEKLEIDPFDLISGKEIRGSWGGGINLDTDLGGLFELFLQDKSVMALLQGNIYPFAEINQAVADFRNGKVLRPILQMDSGR